jgi:rod shape-determining protein MreD
MRFVPYLLYLFLIAFYRTILAELLSIMWVEIYLSALIVLLVALNKDCLTALWFGFAAGLIYDAPDPSYMGVHMIILAIIGVVAAQVKDHFNLESMKSRILLVLAGLFVYSIPRLLVYSHFGKSEFVGIFLQGPVLSVIYSALIGWIFFVTRSGRISYKKLKSLF